MCAEPRRQPGRGHQRGLTFIELIFFIIIVSVGLAGILVVMNQSSSRSADPMVRKQMLAIAESVMEEVRLQSFGWCDPDDTNAGTATSTADCAGGTPAETRGGGVSPWDQVTDYNGASISTSLAGTGFPSGYIATVSVTPSAFNGIAASEALLIQVTVTFGGETLVLQSYRTRYAPNALP